MRINKTSFTLMGMILLSLLLGCSTKTDTKLIEDGVTSELAKLRNQQLSNLRYDISFSIPDSVNQNIKGSELIEFNFKNIDNNPVIIDFRNPESFIKSVKVNKKKINYLFSNEHIIIPSSKFKNGTNNIEIEFTAGNRALNRNNEYLYTLFVPDRACTAFPCFDQPSLKANYQLKLTTPRDWIAIGNSNLIEATLSEGNTMVHIFEKSEPVSTYLFAFVAGKFQAISKSFGNRQITMYHRENDKEKLTRNIDKIFELQYGSLEWLEKYTQIDYPFKKLDFIIIPSFQYSGMEHPGAILYRDSKLLLEETSTIRDELNRANLIAHETAHMWFGDFVTMEWFSEVWLKEVFANFIAGKIVNPQYPNINHDLNFLINHYPSSYSVDRTKGANPIQQNLGNMKNAGTLYGSIIYHKAPIVMNHLEKITGAKLLKEGLQEYLSNYRYGNATWTDLIKILDTKTDYNLEQWSNSWVFEPGMPNYSQEKAFDINNNLQSIIIEQKDPMQKGRQWEQTINILLSDNLKHLYYQIQLSDTFNVVDLKNEYFDAPYIFANSNGLGYGYFELDSVSKEMILDNITNINDPVLKCSMYISLWENMLNQNILPDILFDTFTKCLNKEKNPQNINLILGYIESLYWKFLSNDQRNNYANMLEEKLWDNIQNTNSLSIKSSFFNTYKKIAVTQNAIKRLYDIWEQSIEIENLKLSENDFTDICFELAIRNLRGIDTILLKQYNDITNKERKERFHFIRPALSNNIDIRDSFFEKLMNEKNREKEPWVIDAIRYLHHPLRSDISIKYIRPSLEILEELQITGDIFFPKRWLDATFNGHSSIDAVTEINLFLNENPDFPENLKNKILQSTDLVYRASIVKNE